MHCSFALLAGAGFASVALALEPGSFVFPTSVPMSKRQVSGEQYACHENCGYTIQTAEGEYCEHAQWLDYFEACLECANDFNIWRYYGEGVTSAAEACGLDAAPEPADDEEEGEEEPVETTTAVVETTTSVAVVTSTVVVPETTSTEAVLEPTTTAVSTILTTSEVSAPVTASDVTVSSVWTTSVGTVTTGGAAPNATSIESPPGSAATRTWASLSVFGGAAIALAVSLI